MWFPPSMIFDKVDEGSKIILNLVWFWPICPFKIYFVVKNEFLKAYMMVFNVLDKKKFEIWVLKVQRLGPYFSSY
jgi:hypothetical protein